MQINAALLAVATLLATATATAVPVSTTDKTPAARAAEPIGSGAMLAARALSAHMKRNDGAVDGQLAIRQIDSCNEGKCIWCLTFGYDVCCSTTIQGTATVLDNSCDYYGP